MNKKIEYLIVIQHIMNTTLRNIRVNKNLLYIKIIPKTQEMTLMAGRKK